MKRPACPEAMSTHPGPSRLAQPRRHRALALALQAGPQQARRTRTWRCPTDRLPPPSATLASNPPGSARTASASPACKASGAGGRTGWMDARTIARHSLEGGQAQKSKLMETPHPIPTPCSLPCTASPPKNACPHGQRHEPAARAHLCQRAPHALVAAGVAKGVQVRANCAAEHHGVLLGGAGMANRSVDNTRPSFQHGATETAQGRNPLAAPARGSSLRAQDPVHGGAAATALLLRQHPCNKSKRLAWGTSARRERRSYSPMLLVSRPSITMRPPHGSTAARQRQQHVQASSGMLARRACVGRGCAAARRWSARAPRA